MPAGVSAYVPLANVTVSGSPSSVTFSSINQTYRDLVVIISGSISTSQWLKMTVNGDTSGVAWVEMGGDGSSTFSSTGQLGRLGSRQIDNNFMFKIDLFDYSVTDKHKSVLFRLDQATLTTTSNAGRWGNTSAITSLSFVPNSATWVAGSTIALYGVSA